MFYFTDNALSFSGNYDAANRTKPYCYCLFCSESRLSLEEEALKGNAIDCFIDRVSSGYKKVSHQSTSVNGLHIYAVLYNIQAYTPVITI